MSRNSNDNITLGEMLDVESEVRIRADVVPGISLSAHKQVND